jgi:hypothetical protein
LATVSHDRLDWINAGLMLVAWTLALFMPFHLFLFAYAVLGPLHYATEISWLHDRGYFLPEKTSRRWWLILVGMTLAVLVYGFVMTDLLSRPVPPQYEVSMVYLVLITAAVALFVQRPSIAVGLAALALIPIALLAQYRAFFVAAYLLVTIVHVLVFTAAFVLFGALKSRSPSGIASLGVFAVCIVGCLGATLTSVTVPDTVRLAYRSFEPLNLLLSQLLRFPATSVYDSPGGTAVMRLIAFAYTYHYLNWFSKTSIIGWHHIPRSRAVAIVIAWVAAVCLYAVNFAAGTAVLYAASLLHVLLEFPLNIQTGVGIGRLLTVGNRNAGTLRTASK